MKNFCVVTAVGALKSEVSIWFLYRMNWHRSYSKFDIQSIQSHIFEYLLMNEI